MLQSAVYECKILQQNMLSSQWKIPLKSEDQGKETNFHELLSTIDGQKGLSNIG